MLLLQEREREREREKERGQGDELIASTVYREFKKATLAVSE
jgi:hypothetical protein